LFSYPMVGGEDGVLPKRDMVVTRGGDQQQQRPADNHRPSAGAQCSGPSTGTTVPTLL